MSELIAAAWRRISDPRRDAKTVGTLSVISERLVVEDIPMNRDFLELNIDVPAGDYEVLVDDTTVEDAKCPAITFLVKNAGPVHRWERVDIDGLGSVLPITAAVAVTDADLDRLFGPTDELAQKLVARRPGLADRQLDEGFVRYCALQDLQSGNPGSLAAAGPTGVAVETTQAAAVGQAAVIRPTLFLGDGAYVTAAHAEIWAGYRNEDLAVIAIDTDTGLRERKDQSTPIEDAFACDVGVPIAIELEGLDELPPSFRYHQQFLAGRESPWGDQFAPLHVGMISFPSGHAMVIDPNTCRHGVTVALKLPPDREFPCFVSRTIDGNMALLVRLGDGTPERWALAPLVEGSQDPSGHGCLIDTGTISVVDLLAVDALRHEGPAGDLLRRRVRSSEWLVAAASDGDPDMFSLLGFGGDVPNDLVLGLDAGGNVNALVVDMGGYWYPDEAE